MRYDHLVIATGARCDTCGSPAPRRRTSSPCTPSMTPPPARLSCARSSRGTAWWWAPGYIGLEAADALRRNGLRVTVLERSQHASAARRSVVDRGRAQATRPIMAWNCAAASGRMSRIAWRISPADRGGARRRASSPMWNWPPKLASRSAAPARSAPTTAWRPTCAASSPPAIAPKSGIWSPAAPPGFRWAPRPTKPAAWPAPTPPEAASASRESSARPSWDLRHGLRHHRTLRRAGARRRLFAGRRAIEAKSRPRLFSSARKPASNWWPTAPPRKLLGGSVIGEDGAAGRINVIATALQSGLRVDEFEQLDLAYSPPFATVWDPLLIAAQQLDERALTCGGRGVPGNGPGGGLRS